MQAIICSATAEREPTMRTTQLHHRALVGALTILLIIGVCPSIGTAQTFREEGGVLTGSGCIIKSALNGSPQMERMPTSSDTLNTASATLVAHIPLTALSKQAAWAPLNLIILLIGVFEALILFFSYFFERRRGVDDLRAKQQAELERARSKRLVWRTLTLVAAIIAVAVFVITEDITLSVVLIDQWTFLMVGILALQGTFTALALRRGVANKAEADGWSKLA
jgi:hypothetical protein